MTVRTRTLLIVSALLVLAMPCAWSQVMPILTDPDAKAADPSVKVPEYDVATVKQNKSDAHMMRIMNKMDGFSCDNISLTTLIANAYGIRQDLISGGPGWDDSIGFDVNAKVAGADIEAMKKLSPRQRNSMLQALLADRFKLKIHTETKVVPIYELVLAKGGIKFKELPAVDEAAEAAKNPEQQRHSGMTTTRPGGFTGEGVTIAGLDNQLAYELHRMVVDKTGLKGKYDINLTWTPEGEPKGEDSSVETGPSIFTALQEQLGLKLQSSKGPVETIVIDHAEMPSDN